MKYLSILLILLTSQAMASDMTKVSTTAPKKVVYYKLNVDNDRGVVLHGPVRKWNIDNIMNKMKLYAEESNDPIFLIINSPGGDIVSGFELINLIKSLRAEKGILTYCAVESEAFSMAALIASFCYRTYMQKYAAIMFHEASFGVNGLTFFVVKRVEHIQKYLSNLDTEIATQMGMNIKEYKDLTRHEWWLTAKEAAEFGVVDGVLNNLYYNIHEDSPLPQLLPFFGNEEDEDTGIIHNPLKEEEKNGTSTKRTR